MTLATDGFFIEIDDFGYFGEANRPTLQNGATLELESYNGSFN